MRTHLMLILGMSLSLASPSLAQQAASPAPDAKESREARAEGAALAWLELVDKGDFGSSWDSAATYFKGAVTKEQWVAAAGGVRSPLGALQSRKVSTRTFKTQLPGAPDGEYVVIECETSFANKGSSIETVTPMLEKDGSWKVSGYFIK